MSKQLGADCIEIHTGSFCNLYNNGKKNKNSYKKIKKAADFAKLIGLEVHAGHGLTLKTAKIISQINSISEFNIGHSLISESIFSSLPVIVKKYKKVINS